MANGMLSRVARRKRKKPGFGGGPSLGVGLPVGPRAKAPLSIPQQFMKLQSAKAKRTALD